MILTVIQRPLKTIALRSGDVCIPRGVVVPVLDKDILWEFQPNKLVEGDLSTGGDLYAAYLVGGSRLGEPLCWDPQTGKPLGSLAH
ncbi:V-type proton ATPase catalytic subunit A-like isoform X2 [Silene latifolia]|uniref:V-type proton ATPase catalytic subunit A-like isoform X2 n=1 Tax=Silene latifolia TaxID=37657 RepID=UPI003D77FE5B